jgi:hypothetical protein
MHTQSAISVADFAASRRQTILIVFSDDMRIRTASQLLPPPGGKRF